VSHRSIPEISCFGKFDWIQLHNFRVPVIRPESMPSAEITSYMPRLIRTMPDWITSESPTNQELPCSVLKNALFTEALYNAPAYY